MLFRESQSPYLIPQPLQRTLPTSMRQFFTSLKSLHHPPYRPGESQSTSTSHLALFKYRVELDYQTQQLLPSGFPPALSFLSSRTLLINLELAKMLLTPSTRSSAPPSLDPLSSNTKYQSKGVTNPVASVAKLLTTGLELSHAQDADSTITSLTSKDTHASALLSLLLCLL